MTTSQKELLQSLVEIGHSIERIQDFVKTDYANTECTQCLDKLGKIISELSAPSTEGKPELTVTDCPNCHGSGEMFGGFSCDECDGQGKIIIGTPPTQALADPQELTDERKEFEDVFMKHYGYRTALLRKGVAGAYIEGDAQTAWVFWKERALLTGKRTS